MIVTQHLILGRAKQIMVDVCKALSDSHGSFRPFLPEAEALLGDDWAWPVCTVCEWAITFLLSGH